MNSELINQYIDREAIAEDTKFFTKNLESLIALMDKVKGTKIDLGGNTSLKGLNTGSKEMQAQLQALRVENEKLKKSIDDLSSKYDNLAKKQKEGKGATDALAKSKEKLLYLETQEAKEVAANNELIRKRNQELKNQVREESNVKGSLEQRRAALIRLTAVYDKLSPQERESSQGKRLETVVNGLSDQVKELEFGTKRFQRNVGNYAGSAKIIVDALEKYRVKAQEVTKALGASHPAAVQARKDFEDLRKVTDNPRFEKVANMGDAIQEVRFFQKELIKLESSGTGSPEVIKELKQRLAELTDQIGDTRAEIKALSSDTRAFDLFASSVSFVASTFQAAAGAAVAMGASEEDAAEATKNLVAIENVANGVRGIANELTTKGTAANKAYAFVQGQVAIAMDSTAAAGARLKALFTTLGIGALVIAAGYLVANFNKLKDLFSQLSAQQKLMNEINKQAVDGYVKEKVAVGLLVEEVNSEVTSKERKKEIIAELNEISPTYFGGIKTEKDLIEKLPTAYAKYTEALVLSAKVKAAEAILQENEQKRLLDILDKEEKLAARRKQLASLPANLQAQDPVIKELTADIEELNKEAGQTGSIVTKFILDTRKQLNNLGGDVNGKGFEDVEKHLQDMFETSQNAISNLSELERDAAQRRLDQIKKSFEERKIFEGEFLREGKKALSADLAAQLKSIQANLDLQLAAAADNREKRKQAEDDANKDRILADRDFQDKLTELTAEAEKRRRKIVASTVEGIVDVVAPELSKMAQALDKITKIPEIKLSTKDAQKELDELIAKINKAGEASQQIFSAIGAILDASVTKRKNDIQVEIDALDKKKEKDIELVDQTITNEEEKAAAIESINIRAQVQREALERRQRELDIERARFEKAATIARIVADTAAAVIAALGAKPWTPANIASASLIGAIGATQLAAAIATPVPKFRTGRDGGEATWGIVGDGGRREVMYSQDLTKALVTPATDTLTFIPKGYGIAPSIEDFNKMIAAKAPKDVPILQPLPVHNDNSALIKSMARQIQGLKAAYLSRPEHKTIVTEEGFKHQVTKGFNTADYINNNF
ncbi:hypothetical protein [Paraflavitalea sp. CAU 1676]|uniref:hypothetical protein n=1 Tax=Paraflavitalea sp. CAU 1676 TaxID=3032598 RepID=UPI0023DB07E8|nr:hypothetical protein [Paraflavitalea sp. CAU 1676]MDF2189282.1 hypothetical protein [Paraflavitalea sp. CAU 1676]